ncbi:uncharacterized protein TA11945 [Theileria annulata]|uniref:SfiI-subtelomeric related protein family member n=1 Tax=Theileria annulata TaxID=5874 RepID=Q4UDR8_THEAN|nr:uncharacterized protein TA11945 [Theileria annulata]CAI74771.1 hypothetical protein TA11945 [Theileria annulata]|eukprot:XP_952503.1 hypothetical protein TA11945 [Theileria annulata]
MIIINCYNCVIFTFVIAFKLAMCNEILDISNVDHGIILEGVTESGELYSKSTYCPRAGFIVKMIVDSLTNQLLWDRRNSVDSLNLVDIYSINGNRIIALVSTNCSDSFESNYIEIKNNIWTEISFHRFYWVLDKIKRLRIFNLFNPFEDEHYELGINFTSGLASWTLIPRENVEVYQVRQGQDTIWQLTDIDETCIKIIFFGDTETSKMVNVNTRLENDVRELFFEKLDDGWSLVEKEYFYQKLNLLDQEALIAIADEMDEENQ